LACAVNISSHLFNCKEKYIKGKRRKDFPREIISNLTSPNTKYATACNIIVDGEEADCLIDTGAQTSFY